MAVSIYDQTEMSEQDRKLLDVYKSEYAKAHAAGDTAAMQAANQRAEQLRAGYGYSGGSDGAGYTPLEGYEGLADAKHATAGLDDAYAGVADSYQAQADVQKAELDKQLLDWQKQAYISNEQQRLGLDQQMRAQGVTGGLSESSRVRLAQNYATNRNNANTETMKAKQNVDIALQQNLAQNELARANAAYTAGVTNAQMQQNAAATARNIKQQQYENQLAERQLDMSREQLDLSKEQADLNKYISFISSGLIDDSNAARIASSLGVSEQALLTASRAAQNGDAQSIALSLLSAGIYDPSFVEMLGGKFSAETLQAYANKVAAASVATTSSRSSGSGGSGGSSGSSGSTPVNISTYAANNNYGQGFDDNDWQAAANYLDTDVQTAMDTFKAERLKSAINNGDATEAQWIELFRLAGMTGDSRNISDSEYSEIARAIGVDFERLKSKYIELNAKVRGAVHQANRR